MQSVADTKRTTCLAAIFNAPGEVQIRKRTAEQLISKKHHARCQEREERVAHPVSTAPPEAKSSSPSSPPAL